MEEVSETQNGSTSLVLGQNDYLAQQRFQLFAIRKEIGETGFKKILEKRKYIDAPKMPAVDEDAEKKNPVHVKDLRQNDVLMGRGGKSNNHAGNIMYRDIVSSFRDAYAYLPKGSKLRLAKDICNYIRFKQGRFLKRASDADNSFFYEVGDHIAVAKTSQCLRESDGK